MRATGAWSHALHLHVITAYGHVITAYDAAVFVIMVRWSRDAGVSSQLDFFSICTELPCDKSWDK